MCNTLPTAARYSVNVWLHKAREERRKSELIIVWVTPAHRKEVHRSGVLGNFYEAQRVDPHMVCKGGKVHAWKAGHMRT